MLKMPLVLVRLLEVKIRGSEAELIFRRRRCDVSSEGEAEGWASRCGCVRRKKMGRLLDSIRSIECYLTHRCFLFSMLFGKTINVCSVIPELSTRFCWDKTRLFGKSSLPQIQVNITTLRSKLNDATSIIK